MASEESDTEAAQKPSSEIQQKIYQLCYELHAKGHTRRDIVHHLREHADSLEDHFGDSESWNQSPSEKNVVLPGDCDDE